MTTAVPALTLRKQASGSFLKKRTKKLLFPWARAGGNSATAGPKVFCFFSSEKKALLSSQASRTRLDPAKPTETKVFWFFFSKKNCLPSLRIEFGSYRRRRVATGEECRLQPAIAGRRQLPASRRAWCARAIPQRFPGYATSLEPDQGRVGNHCRRPARPGRANPCRRHARCYAPQARRGGGSPCPAGGGCCRHFRRAPVLAGSGGQHHDGRGRRRVRPGGCCRDPRPLRTPAARPADGPQLRLRPRR